MRYRFTGIGRRGTARGANSRPKELTLIKKFIRLLLGQSRLNQSRSNVEPLVRQIAEQSLAEVCQVVEGRLAGMSVAEARGYVRARATQIVMHEAHLAIAKSTNVEFSSMADIVRQSTERLIPQVIRKMHAGAQQAPRVAA